MRANINKSVGLILLATTAAGSVSAQQQEPPIVVTAQPPTPEVQPAPLDPSAMAKGPEIKGIISARSGDRMRIATADGGSTIVAFNDTTKIKNAGLFGGRNKLAANALLNGLPVTVNTLQAGDTLLASEISLRNKDFKTANMIRNGTAQQFEEQTAATQALRGRMSDIDKYNIKSTSNVYFNTGKANLSPKARAELCTAAAQAEATDNALMLVVGYTDSVGGQDYNQVLSEKRASSVINHLQQACRWKPYRMLTPTGMAEADPLADNSTEEGKAQNRRVSVNILVSKSVDGL